MGLGYSKLHFVEFTPVPLNASTVACGFKEQKLYKQPTTEELQRVILKHKN
jgi:hypothetical protein